MVALILGLSFNTHLVVPFVCLHHHRGWTLPLTTTQTAFISPAGSTYTNVKIKFGYLKTAVSARSAFSVRGSRIRNAEIHDITLSCCCGSWNTFSSNLNQDPVLSYLFAICLLFTFISVSFSSLLQLDGLSATLS